MSTDPGEPLVAKDAGDEPALKRRLNFAQGAALIVGSMIGSGIFTNPQSILGEMESPVAALLCWVFGAMIAYFGAMTYGEWTCRIPKSGGDAPFLDYVYTRPYMLVTYLYSWCRVFFINPGYAGSAALTCAQYFLVATNFHNQDQDSPEFRQMQLLVSFAILFVITTILASSNSISSRVFSVLTLISVSIVTLMGLSFFLLLLPRASFFPTIQRRLGENFDFKAHPPFPEASYNTGRLASTFIYVLWAYDGWSNLASSAGEIVDPNKSIPLANFLGISLVAVIYFCVNLSYISLVPWDLLSSSRLPVAWASRLIPGFSGAPLLMASLIVFCTASCCFMTIYSSSRIAQATGESKMLVASQRFASLYPALGTPLFALLVNHFLSCVFCLMLLAKGSAFFFIVDFVSYLFWIFCLLTVVGILPVKLREGTLLAWKRRESLGIQVYFLGPIFLIFCITFFLLFTWFRPFDPATDNSPYSVNGAAIAVIAVGVIPYYFQIYRPKFQAAAKKPDEEVNVERVGQPA